VKVLAVNGSHRKGKNTALMLKTVLEQLQAAGVETELVELPDYRIEFCRSCNKCLREPRCSIDDDDMTKVLGPKLQEAEGIVLGSPVYWGNVSALMKNFIDRTRWMHMTANLLAGKVGGAVCHAGLRNGGQERCLDIMHQFMLAQGMVVVDSRNQEGLILNGGPMGAMFAGYDGEKVTWRRSVAEDQLAMAECRNLAKNMLAVLKKRLTCN